MERTGEYRKARRVLMAEVEGGYEGVLDGLCEGGLGQQSVAYARRSH